MRRTISMTCMAVLLPMVAFAAGVNEAIDWAASKGMQIVYILHNNITDGTRTFKPASKGAELVPELKVVSDNCVSTKKKFRGVVLRFTATDGRFYSDFSPRSLVL